MRETPDELCNLTLRCRENQAEQGWGPVCRGCRGPVLSAPQTALQTGHLAPHPGRGSEDEVRRVMREGRFLGPTHYRLSLEPPESAF